MRASLSRRVRLVAAGGAVTLAVLVAPVGGARSEEGSARSAAIGGTLTMRLDYPQDRDVVVIGVIANGRLHTPIICADFRTVRFKILNPPTGSPRFTRSPAYGGRDNRYNGGFLPPRTPGTYRYQAIAPDSGRPAPRQWLARRR